MGLHVNRRNGWENIEIRELFNIEDTGSEVNCRRLTWVGHIHRNGEENHLKGVLKINPE